MTGHLEVVIFSGVFSVQFIDVVPENVPALTEVQVGHFLNVDLADFDGLFGGELAIF